MTESPSLQWIRKHQQILSLSALDRYLDLPAQTLLRAISSKKGYRPIPEKHLERFELGMQQLIVPQSTDLLEDFFTEMYDEYKARAGALSLLVQTEDTKQSFQQYRVRNEQLWSSMVRLYILVYTRQNQLADTVYMKLVKANPAIMKGIKMKLEQGDMEIPADEIWRPDLDMARENA